MFEWLASLSHFEWVLTSLWVVAAALISLVWRVAWRVSRLEFELIASIEDRRILHAEIRRVDGDIRVLATEADMRRIESKIDALLLRGV